MSKPVVLPTVAMTVFVADHVPPGVGSVRLEVPPNSHTANGPDIAAGNGLTVTGSVTKQPVPTV